MRASLVLWFLCQDLATEVKVWVCREYVWWREDAGILQWVIFVHNIQGKMNSLLSLERFHDMLATPSCITRMRKDRRGVSRID
ncbi:hypothetical protein F4823DRAFT_580222, partial [Ustulina deusta]